MARHLKLATAPVSEPVSLREAKAHLRVDTNDEDIFIGSLIKAARQQIEAFTGRTFIETTWDYTLDEDDVLGDMFELPRSPVSSITSITTIDDDNVATAMTASDYYLVTNSEPGRVALVDGKEWPTDLRRYGSMIIKYISGYGDEAFSIPDGERYLLKESILLAVGRWFEHRESVETIPIEARVVATPLKVFYL